mgnify:FL=1
MKKKSVSGTELSKIINVPYATIMSIKNKSRDIKNLNALTMLKMTTFFNVRAETLLAINVNDLTKS